MRTISEWFIAHAYSLSHRRLRSDRPRSNKSFDSDGKDGHTLFSEIPSRAISKTSHHSEQKSSNSQMSDHQSTTPDYLRPTLLEDGSHPYYPGTPWGDLELGSTIDDGCKPRRSSQMLPKRIRVFRRKTRHSTASAFPGSLQPMNAPPVYLPPYLGPLRTNHRKSLPL
ncbi:hypothetical protein DFH28DRAFT_881636 [Melampsora americana]|nr:hypothetical protein DFH28DRAFT_881636 [Melampsora americana]